MRGCAWPSGVPFGWAAATRDHLLARCKSGSIQVQFYQVIVEKTGASPLAFTVDLPPNVTVVELPEGLTNSGDELKVEVLVKLVDGNSTAVEGCVVVE